MNPHVQCAPVECIENNVDLHYVNRIVKLMSLTLFVMEG